MAEEGNMAQFYVMKNSSGMEIIVTNYGARLVSVKVPDKDGKQRDVVLGYDSIAEYERDPYCFGATIGRNANRIKNARFILNGEIWNLEKNEYDNNNHSGPDGYHSRSWDVEDINENSVCFSIFSPHLDQGFPGDFKVCVTYTLTEDNEIVIHFEGESTKETVVNMTHHSYFNLDGDDSGNVLNQYLKIYADTYAPIADYQSIPTGGRAVVNGTPMDFREFKKIGKDIYSDFSQLRIAGDYNHSYYLNKEKNEMGKMAEAYSENSGIHMEVWTTLPSVQLYTGYYIEEIAGKKGCIYQSRSGFCLEPQYTPNAINQDGEEKPILKAGEVYDTSVIYKFSCK